jgi:hypothetical protein
MLYREIIYICSQMHTKHINTLCGQNVQFVNVKLAVPKVTAGLQSVTPIQTIRFKSGSKTGKCKKQHTSSLSCI